MNPEELLRELFRTAVAAVHPSVCVPPHLPPLPRGRTVVIGAGKASAAMAKAVEDNWQGALSGLVITRHGHGVKTSHIEIVEAGHPVPDEAGLAATKRIVALLRGLSADDLVLFLGSGGGSSLLVSPAPGISLADKQSVTRALLKSGADIQSINCVRKHLSAVKGGRLALAAQPANVVSLIISDVPGDDPAAIASGPTVPDPTTRQDAQSLLARYEIPVPPAVEKWLGHEAAETPKPGDPAFHHVRNEIIATSGTALEAVMGAALEGGVQPIILHFDLLGEARDFARKHAEVIHKMRLGFPLVILSGGETTVTVRGKGRGGRNTEFLLALALELNGAPDIWALACDTDGIDGTEDNAGAILTPDSLARAAAKNIDARAALDANDSYGFFEAINGLVRVGPTRTNVSDFRAILIMP